MDSKVLFGTREKAMQAELMHIVKFSFDDPVMEAGGDRETSRFTGLNCRLYERN